MPPLLTIAAGVAAFFAALAATFLFLYQGAVDDLTTFKSAVAGAQAQVAAENAALVRQAEQATREVAADYVRDLASLDGKHTSRLHALRRNCAAAGASPVATPGLDDPTKEPAAGSGGHPPPTFETVAFEIERNAAGDALQLGFLQSWVMEVCK